MDWLNRLTQPLEAYSILDANLGEWLFLFALTVAIWFLLRIGHARAVARLKIVSEKTTHSWDDLLTSILSRTHGLFLLLLSLFLASHILHPGDRAHILIVRFFTVGAFFQAALWGNEVVAYALQRYLQRRAGEGQEITAIHLSAYSAVSITSKFLVWTILFLLLLDNLGINITALVTGLGIGGIAIALAVQNILGDIFASLTIVLDRPFEVGDFIVVGDKSGTVESIGLKTSRIKSLSGEQLIFPNKKLVETEIQNFKRMHTRRIAFSFGVIYESTTEQLRKIPEIVKAIIGGIEQAKLDRVHLAKFNDSSLDYEVVYIMQVADYNTYMDVQQEINLALLERFAAEGIEFAYPTQRTVISRMEDANELRADGLEKPKAPGAIPQLEEQAH